MSSNNVVVELRDTEGKTFLVNGIVNGTAEVGHESLQAETRLGDSIEDNEKILRMYLRYLESTYNGNEPRIKRTFLEIVKLLNMVRKPIRRIDFYNYSHYLDIRLKRHEQRYHKQMKKSTVNQIIAMLKNFGDFLSLPHVGIMEYNPAQHLKNKIIYKSERYIDESKYLTEEETRKLLMTAKRRNYRDYVLFAIPVFAGTRQGETLALTWDDIDFKKNVIVIRHAKKDKSRRIPMCDTLVKILTEWKKQGIN